MRKKPPPNTSPKTDHSSIHHDQHSSLSSTSAANTSTTVSSHVSPLPGIQPVFALSPPIPTTPLANIPVPVCDPSSSPHTRQPSDSTCPSTRSQLQHQVAQVTNQSGIQQTDSGCKKQPTDEPPLSTTQQAQKTVPSASFLLNTNTQTPKSNVSNSVSSSSCSATRRYCTKPFFALVSPQQNQQNQQEQQTESPCSDVHGCSGVDSDVEKQPLQSQAGHETVINENTTVNANTDDNSQGLVNTKCEGEAIYSNNSGSVTTSGTAATTTIATTATNTDGGAVSSFYLLPPRTRCHPSLPPLIPPFRYTVIEDGLYRGAYPSLKNVRFLARLRLRTVVSLIPEPDGEPTRDLREFCSDAQIRLVSFQVDKYDDAFSHTEELVARILGLMINPVNHPLFIHCRDGAHNTGLVVMCLRRLQNWTLQPIYDEFIRYTKSNRITFEEKQFVEAFHHPVIIPPRIPPWLWNGVRHRKHPFIQLDLTNNVTATAATSSSTSTTTTTTTSNTTTATTTEHHISGNDNDKHNIRHCRISDQQRYSQTDDTKDDKRQPSRDAQDDNINADNNSIINCNNGKHQHSNINSNTRTDSMKHSSNISNNIISDIDSNNHDNPIMHSNNDNDIDNDNDNANAKDSFRTNIHDNVVEKASVALTQHAASERNNRNSNVDVISLDASGASSSAMSTWTTTNTAAAKKRSDTGYHHAGRRRDDDEKTDSISHNKSNNNDSSTIIASKDNYPSCSSSSGSASATKRCHSAVTARSGNIHDDYDDCHASVSCNDRPTAPTNHNINSKSNTCVVTDEKICGDGDLIATTSSPSPAQALALATKSAQHHLHPHSSPSLDADPADPGPEKEEATQRQ